MKTLEIGKVYTGAEINAANVGPFVKFLNDNMVHHQYQYKAGLNKDTVPFNPIKSCRAGGMYFCKIADVGMWYTSFGNYYRLVTLPENAQVYVEHGKMKADKLILSEESYLVKNKWMTAMLFQHDLSFNGEGFEEVLDDNQWEMMVKRGKLSDLLPAHLRTKEMLELAVQHCTCSRKRFFRIFPPTMFTNREMNKQLLLHTIQHRTFQEIEDDLDVTLIDEEVEQVIVDQLQKYPYRYMLVKIPKAARTRPMMVPFLCTQDWRAVVLFPTSAFDQELVDQILNEGFPFDQLPVAFQTKSMWVQAVKENRVNVASAIPSSFLDQELYEALVSVNAKNLSTIPSSFLTESMMLTAVQRDRSYARYLPVSVRTPAVITYLQENPKKRIKRKDWSRSKKRR